MELMESELIYTEIMEMDLQIWPLTVLVSFTITTDGGLFLFPNLNTDDYYLVFHKPDSLRFSDPNQGADKCPGF